MCPENSVLPYFDGFCTAQHRSVSFDLNICLHRGVVGDVTFWFYFHKHNFQKTSDSFWLSKSNDKRTDGVDGTNYHRGVEFSADEIKIDFV